MSTKINKRTVLITGCSPGGIGYALAREFSAKGMHVIATARNRRTIADLEELGMTTLSLDVCNTESIIAAKDEISNLTGGKLDILVNNAGRDYIAPGVEVDMSEVHLTFETNVYSVILMTQTFIPLLIASEGLVVNIGSVAGIMPYVFSSVYNASKAALHHYSETLRIELEPFNVRVMVIITGAIQSNIARTDRELAPDSLYADITEEYARRVKHSQESGIDNVRYAKAVVKEAMKSHPKKRFWKVVCNTDVVLFEVCWLWVFGVMFKQLFGLNKLIKIVKTRKSLGLGLGLDATTR